MTSVRDIAKGRWKDILPALGIDPKFLQNRHGPCPICGGDDRFRWDDQYGQGGFICSQCGGGDGFRLAGRVTGQTFKQLADKVEEILGHSNDYKGPVGDIEELRQRERMQEQWKQAKPIADVSPVAKYLRARLGGGALRYDFLKEAASVFHPTDGQSYPAMIAKIAGHHDRAVNIHITYLTRDGAKAAVSPSKRVMAGKLPDGCAIRLLPAAEIMGVAEGIETALAASLLFDIPVWACVNGSMLAKWKPPGEAHEIVVFGDNDLNFTGQAKAYELANRLEVQFKRRAKVMIPPKGGTDWNDHYLENEPAKRWS
jgi:putative DNA primase/helicase